MPGWDNFFVAEVGAAAALTGLLFVAVSINLTRVLEFSQLPTRAAETLISLVSVLVVSTFALVPEQSMKTYGIEIAATGLTTWAIQTFALTRTHRADREYGPLWVRVTRIRYRLCHISSRADCWLPAIPAVCTGSCLQSSYRLRLGFLGHGCCWSRYSAETCS
jgi:hypothetical protein